MGGELEETLAEVSVSEQSTQLPGRARAIETTARAMEEHSWARHRALGLFAVGMCAVTAALAPFLPGGPRERAFLFGGLALVLVSNAVLVFVAPRDDLPRDRLLPHIWLIATLGVLGPIGYFGPFSAACLVLVLGVYFAARGSDRRTALVAYGVGSLGHAAIVVVETNGVLGPVGLVRVDEPLSVKVVSEVLIQLVFLGSYVLARASHDAMQRNVAELEDALRALVEREVLLDEQRQELQRVLAIGGPGPQTGQTVGGYVLGPVLGRGGMGLVYEAREERTGTPAAVKVLHPQLVGDREALARFVREAELTRVVESPHVVRVLAASESAEGGEPYLVMERLRGHDLSELLHKRAKLRPADVVDLAKEVGEGLTAAAAVGVVHRDLKPRNIFRAQGISESRWTLLDFGTARLASDAEELTQGRVVGTPAYMAPEQVRHQTVDHRTDLYGLGAVLYRCLVGLPPFRGTDVSGLLHEVVHGAAVPPSSLTEVPEDVDRFFEIALAKDPTHRFQSAHELHGALLLALGGALDDDLRDRARRAAAASKAAATPVSR